MSKSLRDTTTKRKPSKPAKQRTATKSASKSSPKSAPPWESPEWQAAVRQTPGLKPFFDNLESFVELPEGVAKLREMFLQLAVEGKLVDQDSSDEPADQLLVGDVVSFLGGYAFKSEWFQKGPGIRLVRNQNIGHGELDWSDTEYLPNEMAKEHERFELFPGDLVLSLNRPFIKTGLKLAWIRECDCPCLLVQRISCMRPDTTRLTAEYLYLWCNSPRFYKEAHVVPSSGVPYIATNRVAKMSIQLPLLAEQRRIVSKVEGLMSLCDTLEDARRARESVRERASRSVLASLTSAPLVGVQPLGAGEHESAKGSAKACTPAQSETLKSAWHRLSDHFEVLLDQPETVPHLRQSILQLAVQGKLVSLTDEDIELLDRETVVGDFLTMQNGYAFKSQWFEKDGIRLVRNKNIGHGSLDWSDVAKVSEERALEYERFEMVEGDIVLTLDRPLISTGLKVARITKNDLPSLLLQRVARPVFNDDANVLPDYFYTWMQSPYFTDSIDPGKSNGVPHISTREVQKIPFAPPTEASQKRIVSKVSVLLSQCDELSLRLRSRQSTTDALLTGLIHQILGTEQETEMPAEAKPSQATASIHTDQLRSAKEPVSSSSELVKLFAKKGAQTTPDRLLAASRLADDVDLFFQLLREAKNNGNFEFAAGLNQPIRRIK